MKIYLVETRGVVGRAGLDVVRFDSSIGSVRVGRDQPVRAAVRAPVPVVNESAA
jgi:hypothetical protein